MRPYPVFFSPDSPIRNLPLGLEPWSTVALDGVRSNIEMSLLASARLHEDLEAISERGDTSETPLVAAALLDAWSIVDCGNRLCDLLDFFIARTQKAKDPATRPARPSSQADLAREPWKSFFLATRPLRDLRNKYQHFKSNIEKPLSELQPAFGTLHWVYATPAMFEKGCRHESLLTGSVIELKAELLRGVLGSRFRPPVDHIRLEAFGQNVALTSVADTVIEVAREVEKQLREQFGGMPTRRSEVLMSLEVNWATGDPGAGDGRTRGATEASDD